MPRCPQSVYIDRFTATLRGELQGAAVNVSAVLDYHRSEDAGPRHPGTILDDTANSYLPNARIVKGLEGDNA